MILTSKVPLHDATGNLTGIVGTGFDITERKAAEERMASSDRLESIGRLAAGVAHEINTPIQYLNDSVSFIREGVEELLAYIDKLHASMPAKPAENEDVEYMREELPPALTRVADGLSRIAEIVRSMKHFSHADQREMSEVDLNVAIASTLVMARSEYKDVADVETDYATLPPITCHGGQINQVVLNLVVNSAHAIADLVKKNGGRGKITVKTSVEPEHVLISDHRHRRRHSRRHSRADFRSVLHDQGSRTRHRPGPVHRAQRHRQRAWRPARFRHRDGQGHHVPRAPAAAALSGGPTRGNPSGSRTAASRISAFA